MKRWCLPLLLLTACGGGDVFQVDEDIGGYGDYTIFSDTEGQRDDAAPDGTEPWDADPRDPDDGIAPEDAEAPDLAPDGEAPDAVAPPDAAGPDVPTDVTSVTPTFVTDLAAEDVGDETPWAAVWRLTFTHPGLTADEFIETTRQTDPDVVTFFGDNEPPPGSVLLYEGPGCADAPAHATLLVHGAGSHASESWITPPDLLGPGHGKTLMDQGTCVWAVTFPHPFGDCFNQAIQVAAATQAIQARGGAEEITLVAHSKGWIAVVAWLSGFADEARGLAAPAPASIHRLILLGVPLGGTDFNFRHPAFNYSVDLLSLRMPSAWDQILEWGAWKDVLDESVYGGAFPGVLQITAAWDDTYDLSTWESDWYTTYYGGQGFVSHSLGIGEAIALGGAFMADFREHPLPESIPVRVASGGNPSFNGVVWEATGPSDGLVFQASAEDLTVVPGLEDLHHFPLANHLALLHLGTVFEWMTELP